MRVYGITAPMRRAPEPYPSRETRRSTRRRDRHDGAVHAAQRDEDEMSTQTNLRKHTVFMPCERHAAMYASETRYRRAETMVEGGWSSPCPAERCSMKPGTDFYTATFVVENPVYEVEQTR